MPQYRKIFPSYIWEDAWLVNQIVNLDYFIDNKELGFIKNVPVEEGLDDDDEIQEWIDCHLKTSSCLILFVGEKTYTSEWVLYEIEQARKLGKARFIINLCGMTNRDKTRCSFNCPDPYEVYNLYSLSGNGYMINQYTWTEEENPVKNIKYWIEDACERAGK